MEGLTCYVSLLPPQAFPFTPSFFSMKNYISHHIQVIPVNPFRCQRCNTFVGDALKCPVCGTLTKAGKHYRLKQRIKRDPYGDRMKEILDGYSKL